MPRSHTESSRSRPLGSTCRLAELLGSVDLHADTRFARYGTHPVPATETRHALLLMVCGYEARMNGDVIEVRAKDWVPALVPKVEPMLAYLQKQFALFAPRHKMNPDDERLDAVFASVR